MGSGQVQGGNAQEGRRHCEEEVRNDALQQYGRPHPGPQENMLPKILSVRRKISRNPGQYWENLFHAPNPQAGCPILVRRSNIHAQNAESARVTKPLLLCNTRVAFRRQAETDRA
jgi:hypothetical protein